MAVLVKVGKMEAIAVDGVTGPAFDHVVVGGLPVGSIDDGYGFSPDGRRFAYMGQRGKAWWLVVDGEVQAETETREYWWTSQRFSFTADSRHWYIEGGRFILDGKTVAVDVSAAGVGPDGSRFWYLLGGGTLVVQAPDGEPSRHERVGQDALVFSGPWCHCVMSPDGRRLTWSEHRDRRWVLVVDGTAGAPYEDLEAPVFSPDSRRVAYAAKLAGQWTVVVDGQPGAPYEKLESIRVARGEKRHVFWSADSQHLAYAAKRRGKWVVVVDSREGEEYDDVGTPTFSPVGSRLAFYAKRSGRWFIVVDGAAGKPYEDVGQLVFSPDGRRVVYVARSGKRDLAVLDGEETGSADEVSKPAFSPGGEHLAYGARRGDKWTLVVDGVEVSTFDSLLYSPWVKRGVVFTGSNRLNALIIRGKEIRRLEVERSR